MRHGGMVVKNKLKNTHRVVFRSSFFTVTPVCKESTFESRKNTPFCAQQQSQCISDVINKAGRRSQDIKYVTSQPFPALH